MKHYDIHSRNALLDMLDIDFRYIDGPTYIGPPLAVHGDGSEDDLWGVPRKTMMTGEGEFLGKYKAVTKHPLEHCKTVDDVLGYDHWPDPGWFDYNVIPDQCKRNGDRVVMFMGDRLNRIAQLKPAMYLRGIAKVLADMRKKDNAIFLAIRDKIRAFYTEYLRRIVAASKGGIDVIVTGDDFGTQSGLMFSPDTWRANLMQGFKEFISIAKSRPEIKVMHHSCGSIRPIIGDMIACGLDILNPIQPGVHDMDHATLKEEFGKNVIFHGGISLQGPLRFGTPAGVLQEVKQAASTLGRNGGYIICTAHNIQADTKTENLVALFDAYKKI